MHAVRPWYGICQYDILVSWWDCCYRWNISFPPHRRSGPWLLLYTVEAITYELDPLCRQHFGRGSGMQVL